MKRIITIAISILSSLLLGGCPDTGDSPGLGSDADGTGISLADILDRRSVVQLVNGNDVFKIFNSALDDVVLGRAESNGRPSQSGIAYNPDQFSVTVQPSGLVFSGKGITTDDYDLVVEVDMFPTNDYITDNSRIDYIRFRHEASSSTPKSNVLVWSDSQWQPIELHSVETANNVFLYWEVQIGSNGGPIPDNVNESLYFRFQLPEIEDPNLEMTFFTEKTVRFYLDQ